MTPYFDSGDGRMTLYCGDCVDVLRQLPSESVQCVVTSPPYWGLRDYGVAGQIGLEPTMQEYVARMVDVFREVRRVLRNDGTCWVNLGDSYAQANYGSGGGWAKSKDGYPNAPAQYRSVFDSPQYQHGLKPKDLCGIPWRVAFALQADGWWLRSDIIWSKPNPMPESVTDRPTKAHEYVFLLTKSARYYYDAEAIREVAIRAGDWNNANETHGEYGMHRRVQVGSARNRRTVWEIATQPCPEAHFATYPEKLVEPCVLAGTSERGCCAECGTPWDRQVEKSYPKSRATRTAGPVGEHGFLGGLRRDEPVVCVTSGWCPACVCGDKTVPCTVLDPFSGSGTTGSVALRLGRRYIGIELSQDYLALSMRRLEPALAQPQLPLEATR